MDRAPGRRVEAADRVVALPRKVGMRPPAEHHRVPPGGDGVTHQPAADGRRESRGVEPLGCNHKHQRRSQYSQTKGREWAVPRKLPEGTLPATESIATVTPAVPAINARRYLADARSSAMRAAEPSEPIRAGR
jgi:hypothetical protein